MRKRRVKLLAGGCAVIPPDREYRSEGTRRFRVPISKEMGAHNIIQTVSIYDIGRAPSRRNPFAEEVLYVIGGFGVCRIDEFAYPLRPETAVYIPPRSIYQIRNTQDEPLEIVSVACPEDPVVQIDFPLPHLSRSTPPKRTVLARTPESTPNRTFKALVNREHGCKEVSQFIGLIPSGRGSMHSHSYEVAIYILEGEGRIWVNEGNAECPTGASIYVPRGISHCLENQGKTDMRIHGVFHPASSHVDQFEE